jgi:hypothetical protein
LTLGSAEDRRAAASLVATLSSYVITAALAVLGAQAVITTFVLDRREELTLFYVLGGLGAAMLVLSVLIGCAGIYEIAAAGSGGDWKVTTRRGKFNLQAICALVGTVLVIASAFQGERREDATAPPAGRSQPGSVDEATAWRPPAAGGSGAAKPAFPVACRIRGCAKAPSPHRPIYRAAESGAGACACPVTELERWGPT